MEKYLALILLIIHILHLDVGNGNLLRQRRQDYYEDDYYPEEEDYPTNGGEEGPVTVYKNGKIYTVAGSDWWLSPKTAVVVADGKIKYVGDDASAENLAVAGSKIVDLGGKTVLPGIHDVHQHPLEAGDDIVSCQLDTDTSPNILKDYVFDCAKKASPTEWVLGNGHSIRALLDYLKTGGPSPRALLDSVVPDRPVVMLEETSHSVWVNSKALEKAGFLKGVANPSGGVIMKDSTGEPNGILLENAGNIVMGIALDPNTYPQLLKKQYDGLVYTLGVLAENGITSVVDARCYWKRSSHETYEKVKKDGLLTSRAVLALWAYPQLPDSQIVDLKALFSNTDPMLRRNQIKVYSDGLLDSTTAAMFSPYKIELGLGLGTGNTGMNYFTEGCLFMRLNAYADEKE
ncbi:uncharacterized protein LOC111705635 [Eurytemora carolleeae]|uniref:uncharacterized protein LOC111705635 n=1 Tax=Eurytemora carolleeae TaxID=1294199 RepID=UPI000C7860A4|nr:uncharacterized protein LOC111705635 [Eurytemora carolleeae]|eukprot:XP_023334018.1 uncharacterized protein LOC111705635 [Eurytemora affinis]